MSVLELELEIARHQVLVLGHPGYNGFALASVEYGLTMDEH